ncbi:NO-inducible flavohemoprotein [Luteibacter yeojuensis]|uniref:nitric oxide dioxygenase n=1 Tax=Luteibacter yeojuensis TaxID=345309 RepID=A0A7X5TR11_9GAMM|nr:NO-inducible flavohemoprotein [Luteibacter yeojuensis]NID16368.1 NO-inducible flavohemoprotein [Luteibacter yeojuensis]
MLSPEHRALVRATVPLLETGGEALTNHFYRILLGEHPEVRPYFNQANQITGEQPRALANGVLMYAKHIDRLEALGDLVDVIVNKHVSLRIRADHYPIVGRCLLRAIREVLGPDVATDEIIDAWGAAYGQLAGILSGAEATIYDAVAEAPGGWRDGRAFRVIEKVRESDEITSFRFAPVDGQPVYAHAPGQYIGLRVHVHGVDSRRNYSLSAAADGVGYRISVKRVAGGAVSTFLHDDVQVGDTVELFPPSGHFVLEENERPLVLISGGVGITPTLAMLERALPSGRPIHFIHSARHGGVHAFRDTIDSLAASHPQLRRYYCYEKPRTEDVGHEASGYLDRNLLAAWLPGTTDIDAYFLGPKPFMKAVRKALRDLGVADARARYEFFGPASSLD